MKVDWSPLRRVLAGMRAQNVALPIWWRDDDAIAQTPALERLIKISEVLQVPLHLAVIPDLAEPCLPAAIQGADDIVPLVHGWMHRRHFLKGKKDTEFGIRRTGDIAETVLAMARMESLFKDRLSPIFVPPWNRIAESLVPELAAQGYSAVSTFMPREDRMAAEGMVQINTHLDPIDWRGKRGLIAPDKLVAQLTALLEARLNGIDDATEPLGLLTHHLVHTEGIWDFSHDCLAQLLDGGAVPVNLRDMEGVLP